MIECTSPLGIKIGLIDSIMTQAKVIVDMMVIQADEPEFIEALKDLYDNPSLKFILQYTKVINLTR